MKYFLDTEFIDDGKTIDLISIGIVTEDGRKYYAQSVDFNHRKASAWVKENVLTHLLTCPWAEPYVKGILGHRTDKAYHRKYGQCVDWQRGYVHNCPWRTREQIRDDLRVFCDPEKYGKPEFIGWCAGYDWVALCQLFGTMMDLPDGWSHYIKDIQYLLDERSLSDDQLPPLTEAAHNALADARYIQQLWSDPQLWVQVRGNELYK